MQSKFITLILGFGIMFGGISSAHSLTVQEVQSICSQQTTLCADNLVIQAYIGGGLDMLASLYEHEVLHGVRFCKSPQALFDVTNIINFLLTLEGGARAQNAMRQVTTYLQGESGC